MQKRNLGKTGLQIVPLVFGGNVFGWTLNEQESFKILDAIVDLGLNAIDTADVYSRWAPGNVGGESETIMGKWLKANPQKRDKLLIFTKVGADMGGDNKGLSKRWIMHSVEASLKRLQIDVIDLYQSHWPDANTAYEETLSAYDQLLKEGKIKAIGASNLNADQLSSTLQVAKEKGLPAYQTLQPEYNLYDRQQFNKELRELVVEQDIGVITYYSLASGFLSGKYRNKADLKQGPRGEKVAAYMNDRGMRMLNLLEVIAQKHQATQAEISLAWLMAQKEVTAPIASATTTDQLQSLVKSLTIQLTNEDLIALNQA
ncbi:aldo/keto reductase [Commensalibacter papalotli (ex Botero et al. 2024)]|uniref:Aldo/keto reductase family (PdxI) (PDB:1LQA) (PUBMED:32253339) n=1 Tax=Commensalibacter papalotli (ex Botero et al. 2024) TaxID=2972766 RepID=A0ABN8W8G8_9PROT|nr:aldo/keto reductase [Commensalibacter papalotli (ex Botero et al. 2024)]CAI3931847.1 Pyridoxal reductase PdxI or related oxidoreductase [Commensalibacter papalotli (ex Botero et al. 2024)]CAI3943848.1 Pyridoxal reductase PdxI or related oxidoreductase [Commensalibacter papalotli (ex Botero et al. 2024)]